MELSLATGLKRLQQPAHVVKKETGEGSPAAASARSLPQLDQVALSREAVAYIEEQHRRNMERIQRETQKMAAGSDEEGDSEADILGKQLETTQKCMEIARRIMRGDKVPPQDEKYLMENDPNGYKLALAMRKPKKHPKKWKSVLEDEEKQDAKAGGDGGEDGGSAEGASESAASGGSGDSGSSGSSGGGDGSSPSGGA